MKELKIGHTEDGHSYLGGDPSSPENWKQVGSVEDGHIFKGGDPSSPNSWETIPDNTPQPRSGEAFIQGFGNAASFGYLPQLQAIAEPAIQGALDFIGGDNTDQKLKEQGFTIDQAPEESYVQRRDRYIGEGKRLAQENPGASLAGNVAGALSSGIATGGGLSNLLGTTGKAATFGSRMGDAVKTGATIGALRNPGDTKGEVNVLQLEDRAKNALKDAATGAVIQGGFEGVRAVGTGIKNAGKNLSNYSQNKALKSSGAMLKDFRKAYGNKKASELGQAAIDEKIVNVGDDIADIAKNAEISLKDSGNKIGNIYNKADDITSISSGDIRKLNNDYLEEASKRLEGTVDGKQVSQKIDDILSTLNENPNPTFGELRKLRASIDDQINYAKSTQDLPKYQEELLHVRNKIQDLVKKRIGDVNPSLAKDLARENKRFSNISDITKMAKDKMAREEANAAFGLRERISGGAGAVLGGLVGSSVGGPVGTAIGGAVGTGLGTISTKVARQYGTPFVAITANKVAKALQNNQGALGKFSKPLIEASNNPEMFVATVNNLLKEPEFENKVYNMEDGVYRSPAKGELRR
ncbi:MAG: hypothetical protein AB7I27_00345 [Bacteriovoracaceae bacterium]